MLRIKVPGIETFNDETQTFETAGGDCVLELEHSLLALSKWESKFEKPFLTGTAKSVEEILFYIESMIITPDFPIDVIDRLTRSNFDEINTYIESKQSATTFADLPGSKKGRHSEIVTSEVIYYWMLTFNIPMECERWHLSRLFSLIRVCNAKNAKPKKMSRSEMVQQRQQLNAERKAKLGTTG